MKHSAARDQNHLLNPALELKSLAIPDRHNEPIILNSFNDVFSRVLSLLQDLSLKVVVLQIFCNVFAILKEHTGCRNTILKKCNFQINILAPNSAINLKIFLIQT